MRIQLPAFLFFVLVIMGVSACKSYKTVSLASETFYTDKELPKDIGTGYYNLYVHHGTTAFRMKDAELDGQQLKGKLERMANNPQEPQTKAELKAHKNDIHIYMNNLPADTAANGTVTLRAKPADVRNVTMVAKDSSKNVRRGLGAIIVFLIAVVILVGGVVWLAVASANSVNGTNNNTTNGSGSNSGGSNSGNSNSSGSGGSNSNSGCYVATMVYGSYEAPEVWVLRNFRDRFLARFYFGRKFISWYYKNSPAFVEQYKDAAGINRAIRFVLNILVRFLAWAGFRN